MTTPILTGNPPQLLPTPSDLPPVGWCIAMLEWVGWVYESRSTQFRGRTYIMRDPNGKAAYFTTYGLRHAALELWIRYCPTKKSLDFLHETA
jgi:hypothetical protein